MDKALWAIIAIGIFLIFMASFAFTAGSSTQGHVVRTPENDHADPMQIAIGIAGLAVIVWGITRC